MLVSATRLAPEKGCAGGAQQKAQHFRTDFSSERAPHNNKPVTVEKQLKKEGKKLVVGPRWVPDIKTDWPTDRRS
jgi:hypothetical protein